MRYTSGPKTISSPSNPQPKAASPALARAKKPATASAGPAGAVLVNTFFWKILVTRVNEKIDVSRAQRSTK
jgi:hypothetical protein